MKRTFTLLILFCLFVPIVYAQGVDRSGGYARILSLGNNPYVVDPEGIKLNPAWASEYSDFIWGDIGSNGNGGAFGNTSVGQFFGGNFDLGHGLTLGGLLTRNDFNSFSIGRLDPFGIVGAIPNAVALSNNLEILGAYKIGKLGLGLGIAYASTTNESTPATGNSTKISAKQLGINAGILTKITSSVMIDGAVSLIFPSAENDPGTGTTVKISQSIIGVAGRVFLKYSSKVSFIPAVAFITESGTFDNGIASTDLTSATFFSIGFGIEYKEGDFMLIGGPGFATASNTTSATPASAEEVDKQTYYPVWNIGAEWNATDWLIGRLGYVATTFNYSTDQTALNSTQVNETTMSLFLPGQVTLGIGLRFGDFALDGTVNADVLRQGLNNIGGGGATFAYLSTSYAF